jgi:hypothetical protein
VPSGPGNGATSVSDPVLADFVNKNSKSPRVTADQTARLPDATHGQDAFPPA